MFITKLRADSGDRSPGGEFWFTPIGARTSAGIRVNSQSALALPAVWSCGRVLAESFAVLPFMLYQPKAGGRGRTRVTQHWLERLMCRKPNRFQSPYEWRLMLQWHLALRGNAFCQISEDGRGNITELLPLNPDRMSAEMLPGGNYRYRYVDDSGRTLYYLRSEIWHLRGVSTDGIVGLNPIEVEREAIGEAMAMQSYASRFFANDAKPGGGWIEHPGGFASTTAKKIFRESWQEMQGGANRGKVAVLERGMKFHELGLNNVDAQFIEGRGLKVADICRIFRMPPHKIQDLQRCMPADTLVFTSSGPKRIADVRPGDSVWSPTPTGPKLCRVVNHWDNGVREVLEIRTTNRTVRCTSNHRLLVRRAFERDLNPGEIGGRNVDGVKKRVLWKNVYVAAGELTPGDTLVTLGRLPSSGVRTAPNGRQLTVGFMEFAGLLAADGNITYGNGRPRGAQIARGEKANYMAPYREAMQAEFVRFPPGGGRGALALAAEMEPILLRESVRQTVFSSVQAGQELFDLGFHGTAFTKRVPGWVFGLADDLQLAFLRGFLDGDGTVDAKGRITYYSASKPLLDDIRHLCMGMGVPVTNARSDVNGTKAFGRRTRMWRFTCSNPGANLSIGSHDARYVTRLNEARPFGRKDRAYPRFGGRDFVSPGMALSRINGIDRLPAEPVYDIEVEGEHCFFADGVASHNSTNNNIEHQGIEFWNDTMRPYSCLWSSSIGCFLLGEESPLQPTFDMSEVLMGDSQARSRYWSTMTAAGILTRNEGRESENYDPLDGLDEPLQPMNMAQAGANAVQPQDRGQPQNSARMMSMLQANAGRMARRLAAGKEPTPEALAESLAVDVSAASEWLDNPDNWPGPEAQIAQSLMDLALKEPA